MKAMKNFLTPIFFQKNRGANFHSLRASLVTNGVGGGAIIEGGYGVYMNTESILGRQW